MKLWEVVNREDSSRIGYVVTEAKRDEVNLFKLCKRIAENTDYEFDLVPYEEELLKLAELEKEFEFYLDGEKF